MMQAGFWISATVVEHCDWDDAFVTDAVNVSPATLQLTIPSHPLLFGVNEVIPATIGSPVMGPPVEVIVTLQVVGLLALRVAFRVQLGGIITGGTTAGETVTLSMQLAESLLFCTSPSNLNSPTVVGVKLRYVSALVIISLIFTKISPLADVDSFTFTESPKVIFAESRVSVQEILLVSPPHFPFKLFLGLTAPLASPVTGHPVGSCLMISAVPVKLEFFPHPENKAIRERKVNFL